MRLVELSLTNFKGVRKFTLRPEGESIVVYGDNATGKTTLVDAFTWLLFGKDSKGRADFQVKTLQPGGEPRHNLEHSVEAVLADGDELVTFKRTYREKWTKQRGSARKEFTGHETEYAVDGVPMRKADFEARVAQIAPEETFRLLTDPLHFNERLHWEDRRRVLVDLIGDVTDDEVIAANRELKALPEVLDGRSAEDTKAILEASRRRINKELAELPVRIDEASSALGDADGLASREELQEAYDEAREVKAQLEAELATLRSGGALAAKRQQLAEAKAALLEHRMSLQGQGRMRADELREKAAADKRKLIDAEGKQRRYQGELEELERKAARLAKRRDELRAEWRKEHARTFQAPEVEDVCPHCGQQMPADHVAAALESARVAFNEKRGLALSSIRAMGKQVAGELDDVEHQIADLKVALEEVAGDVKRLQAAVKKSERAAEAAEKAAAVPEDDEKLVALQADVEALEASLAELQEGSSAELERLQASIRAAEQNASGYAAAIAKLERLEQVKRRIAELEARESELAAEFEATERGLHLIDLFARTKAELLTERINEHFELARFKLFEEQVNGGLKATCVTTFEGVPYTDLNHGARLNVGLDIIRALSDHYGVTPPVFVDNAESVTRLIEMPGQVIKLVVSEDDKKLRVEAA